MQPSFPAPLHTLAAASLIVAAVCAVIIALDEIRRPQTMWIMNLVWPLAALFGSVLWLAGYYLWGRTRPEKEQPDAPFPVSVAKSASHCGAGCTLGDILAEWLAFAAPVVAVWFGWHGLFAEKMFAVWIPDFLFAFAIGIAFQYFTIRPMGDLSPREALVQALKADIASILSWQVGMYGMMAILQLAWFRGVYGGVAAVDTPEFWFAMQIAMLAGFATAYPTNWLLVRAGVKEAM